MNSTPIGKELVQRLLTSESKGEILTLFHKNPGLIDSMDGVARRIGKGKNQIEDDVKDFLEMGLLRSKTVGQIQLISLDKSKDMEVQNSLADYFRGLGK